MVLWVSVEDLVRCGSVITGLGEDLALACNASESLVDSALGGWRGRSALALADLVELWTVAGRGFLARLSELAQSLSVSAAGFSAQESLGARAM